MKTKGVYGAKALPVYWTNALAVYQALELRKEMEEEVAPLWVLGESERAGGGLQ